MLLSCNPSYAKWELVHQDEESKYYIDLDNINCDHFDTHCIVYTLTEYFTAKELYPELRNYYTKTNNFNKVVEYSKMYNSMMKVQEINCDKRYLRLRSVSLRYEGSSIKSYNYDDKSSENNYILPGTIGIDIYNTACKNNVNYKPFTE